MRSKEAIEISHKLDGLLQVIKLRYPDCQLAGQPGFRVYMDVAMQIEEIRAYILNRWEKRRTRIKKHMAGYSPGGGR